MPWALEDCACYLGYISVSWPDFLVEHIAYFIAWGLGGERRGRRDRPESWTVLFEGIHLVTNLT